jgi:hypothetical protein
MPLHKMTLHKLGFTALLIASFAGIAQADIFYEFNLNASTDPNNPLEAFSFSFTAPTFVGNPSTPAFTPFTVTDGTHSWTMTEDWVGTGNGINCFEFGTGAGEANLGSCGAVVAGIGGEIQFASSVLPTATGTYGLTPGFGGILLFAGGGDFPGLTGTLTVSEVSGVPEPTSILLLTSILCAVGWRVRRRAA